jgi:hypothetical protein
VESAHAFAPLDPGQQSAQASNAVLDFKSKGVDKVLVATNILGLIAFANAQNSQDYYPLLGIGDYQITASAAPGNAQYVASLERSMQGAIGVSVLGVIKDKPTASGSSISKEPGAITPGLKRCIEVLSKYTKKDYYSSSNTARGRGWQMYCDNFFLWLETARKTGAAMTRLNWGQQIPALGSSFASALVHATRFAHDEYSGAADYRIGRYYSKNTACVCYQNLFPGQYFPLPVP